MPGGNRVRWSRTGTYVYYQEEVPYNSGILRLRRWEVSTGNVSDFGTLTALDSFDITHDGEKLVYGSLLAPKLFNFETMADTSESIALCDNGRNFHYSPTGSNFVYRRGANGGEFVVTSRSDCQGGPTSVTGKGSWGYLDWRPDPVTGP